MKQSSNMVIAPKYFLVASMLYLTAAAFLGEGWIAQFGAASVIIGFVAGLLARGSGQGTATGFTFALILPFTVINILVSTEPGESAARWGIWFVLLLGMGMLATQVGRHVELQVTRVAPFCMAMITVAKYYGAMAVSERQFDIISGKHLAAFYSSMTIATGLFHPRPAFRWAFALLGVGGVLLSGSRAAFLFMPLCFVVPGLYYAKRPSTAAGLLIAPALLLGTILMSDDLRGLTFGAKASMAGKDAFEAARASFDTRAYLRSMAIDMIMNKPLGYGYGDTYDIPIAFGKNLGTNFHNGLLNVGAAMGVHFLLVYVCFFAWIVRELLKERRVPRDFRFLTLSVIACVCLRSVSEDFTLFDLGTPVCYLLLYLILYFLTARNHVPSEVNA